MEEKIKVDIGTSKYTYVEHEKDYKFNAPHHFTVRRTSDNEVLGYVNFQEGPIKECGVNGVANEDLIVMVMRRLGKFQDSEYKCEENEQALSNLTQALVWLRMRTDKRETRGVEGTSEV